MRLNLLSRWISTQTTPNPSCLKFFPGKLVLPEGTCDFSDPKYATNSPLAANIFKVSGVNRVFYSKEYISVTIQEIQSWESLRPLISTIIEDYFTQNLPVFTEEMHEDDFYAEDDTETVQIIKEILEGRVRPYVQEDGGDIKFKGFSKDTGIVKLEMRGSCAGCPSSGATLKEGIEKMMMFYLPEVKGVEAVDS